MTITQIINNFYSKKFNFLTYLKLSSVKFLNLNPVIIIGFVVVFSILYFTISNLINAKNEENKENLSEVTRTGEFSNLKNYFISKINSPYKEVNYIIKNNDTIEKILRNFKIKNIDIKNISTKLKEKKLSNIYSGRKLSLIYKKLDNNTNTVVNLIYPVSNTSSIEIRKTQNNFVVKENILQLYKKEVVKYFL